MAWKKYKKITDKMIKFRRNKYMEHHKFLITESGSSAHFFKHVRAYNLADKPKKSRKLNLSDHT